MQNSQHLPVGYKIQNRYEVLEAPNKEDNILGQGGFGIVYLVADTKEYNKLFVIKELIKIELNDTIDNQEISQEPIKEEPKIKLIKDIEFDKSKMINNLEDRDILTLTKNSISFSFEADRLIVSKPKSFYNNKLIWKLKNPKYQVGQGITKKLKKQQFASKVVLGVHGDMVHLVVTLRDGYSFDLTKQSGYEIMTFYKKIEGR